MRRLLVVAFLMASACRDEQAGPRPKAPRPAPQQPAPPQQPAQPPAPRALDGAPADLTWKSGATFAGGAVAYLGSKVEPARPQAGQLVTFRHYFQAVKAPPQGYMFFVHVIDADTKQMLGNLDHEFQQGAAPLASWPSGKVMEDVHQLQLPNYPGTLQLVMGFWNDAGRLPPDDAALQDGQGRVLGPKLGGAPADLPEYRAPRAAKAPTVDGKLDDEAWRAAPAVQLVRSGDGGPVSRKTTLRLAWDDQFLYAAFDCEDPDVWGTLRKKDDPIYNQDAVEVFLDANGDGATYNELQVSPHNVNFDASFVARRSDLAQAMAWESGMTSAVQVNGTLDDDKPDMGWTAELKIPLAALNTVPRLPPQKGDVWRFNAYRLEHLERFKSIEGQAFSPLFAGDFHHLPRFGRLIFD